jgi:hypothetical protein
LFVCFVAGISLEELGDQVCNLGERLGSNLDLPVLLYGSAHPEGKTLAGNRFGIQKP